MATLYYAEHVHIVQTRTQIPNPYLCIGQSVPKFVSGKVNETLGISVTLKVFHSEIHFFLGAFFA